ncbi:hypothetical protein KDM41_06785 [bacterium]|nr:hypothetical protein [bacterium]
MKIGPFELPASWPASTRNARGIAVAAVLLVGILSMLSLRCNPVVGRDAVQGLVLEVEAEGLTPFGDGQVMSRVLLAVPEPDTAQVRVFLPPPVPRTGDFVPLLRENYKKGNVAYQLDRERWLIDGPAQARP